MCPDTPRERNRREEMEKPEMGSQEEEEETNKTPKFSLLLSKQSASGSSETPYMLNSPLHTLASVPFCWEKEPGKPKCSATGKNRDGFEAQDSGKFLELGLPPRLLFAREIGKMPSPSSRRFESSPLKMMMLGSDCYGSFRGGFSPTHGETEQQQPGALVVAERRGGYSRKPGVLGFWKKQMASRGKREVGGGSYVFPSSMDRESELGIEREDLRLNRAGRNNNLSASKSRFWVTMYKGLKQVVPWKNKE